NVDSWGFLLRSYHSHFFRPNFPVSFALPIALALIMYAASAALAPSTSGPPKSVSICAQPEGRLEPSDLPAFFLSWFALAGMLTTSQCHQPAPPVGASGSCTSSAKLFVFSGAPDQASAGETFSPEQPKPL